MKAQLGVPPLLMSRCPVFKVPAPGICCKPQEAPHEGLQEESPTLHTAIRALVWLFSVPFAIPDHNWRREVPAQPFEKSTPPVGLHLHESPGRLALILARPHLPHEPTPQRQRPAGPAQGVCAEESVTQALSSLPRTFFSSFKKKKCPSGVISTDFGTSCYLFMVRNFVLCNSGRPAETFASVVTLALLLRDTPPCSFTSRSQALKLGAAAWRAKTYWLSPSFPKEYLFMTLKNIQVRTLKGKNPLILSLKDKYYQHFEVYFSSLFSIHVVSLKHF